MGLEVSNRYRGARGEEYAAKRGVKSEVGLRINFEYFKPYLRSSDRVLEFGCGTGGLLNHIAPAVRELEALEVNEASAKQARALGHQVYASLDELPADRPYDVIVSNHVLEHIADVVSTLKVLRRFLVPGGRFVTKLPIDAATTRHQRRWAVNDLDNHLHTWTPRLFANTFIEAGYEVEECRIITSAWHPRLFPVAKIGLARPTFWALSIALNRRQLFAVARRLD